MATASSDPALTPPAFTYLCQGSFCTFSTPFFFPGFMAGLFFALTPTPHLVTGYALTDTCYFLLSIDNVEMEEKHHLPRLGGNCFSDYSGSLNNGPLIRCST